MSDPHVLLEMLAPLQAANIPEEAAEISYFDILAGITGKTFPVSRIRIRKFCAQTVFSSKKMQESGFEPPYQLDKALVATVKHEFMPQSGS